MKDNYTKPSIRVVLISAIRSMCTLPSSVSNTQIEKLEEDEFEW